MNHRLIYILIPFLLLSSCFKEDDKVPAHDPGEMIDAQVALHVKYTEQVYFDLSSAETVSSNQKDIFDLSFESGAEGWHVMLNSACKMYAAASGITDFEQAIDTTGFDWKYDKSDGNLDSTAIGNYFSYNPDDSSYIFTDEVYVIDRGYYINAAHRGVKKVVFQYVNDSVYRIRYANLDGSEDHTFSIVKEDPELANLSYFSFEDGGSQLYPEPPVYSYDLLFSQYTTLLFTDVGDPQDYLVTGALVNRQNVETVRITDMAFEDITYETALLMEYTGAMDNIGWDWKELDGDVTGGGTPVYLIEEGLYYVIRDFEGYLYKLRFTSYYNSNGDRGYPRFEYQRL